VRKQHCLELAEYLVEAGIDMDYHGAGETALQCLIDLFCKEAAQCLSVSVAASTGGFDAKGACLALAENGATKMTQMDYQNEEVRGCLAA
jgi:methylmalonyl-CoA mutase cobalamin-binding subunit